MHTQTFAYFSYLHHHFCLVSLFHSFTYMTSNTHIQTTAYFFSCSSALLLPSLSRSLIRSNTRTYFFLCSLSMKSTLGNGMYFFSSFWSLRYVLSEIDHSNTHSQCSLFVQVTRTHTHSDWTHTHGIGFSLSLVFNIFKVMHTFTFNIHTALFCAVSFKTFEPDEATKKKFGVKF